MTDSLFLGGRVEPRFMKILTSPSDKSASFIICLSIGLKAEIMTLVFNALDNCLAFEASYFIRPSKPYRGE